MCGTIASAGILAVIAAFVPKGITEKDYSLLNSVLT